MSSVCDQCGKEYDKYGELVLHIIRSHALEKIYECEFCDASYALYADFLDHLAKHASDIQ